MVLRKWNWNNFGDVFKSCEAAKNNVDKLDALFFKFNGMRIHKILTEAKGEYTSALQKEEILLSEKARVKCL